MSTSGVAVAPGRSCAGCTMCCKLMTVTELSKPGGSWCTHCDIGNGCRIYADRPQSCATFFCVYLLNPTLGEHWKPSHSRMVVTRDAQRVNVIVDPERPDAWRKEPYHSDLRKWAASFARQQTMVAVTIGETITIVLPDRDVPLGRHQADKVARLVSRTGPKGVTYDVEILDAPPVPQRS